MTSVAKIIDWLQSCRWYQKVYDILLAKYDRVPEDISHSTNIGEKFYSGPHLLGPQLPNSRALIVLEREDELLPLSHGCLIGHALEC